VCFFFGGGRKKRKRTPPLLHEVSSKYARNLLRNYQGEKKTNFLKGKKRAKRRQGIHPDARKRKPLEAAPGGRLKEKATGCSTLFQ